MSQEQLPTQSQQSVVPAVEQSIFEIVALVLREARIAQDELGKSGERLTVLLENVHENLRVSEPDIRQFENDIAHVNRFFIDQRNILHNTCAETLEFILKTKYMKLFKNTRTRDRVRELIYFLELRSTQLLWATTDQIVKTLLDRIQELQSQFLVESSPPITSHSSGNALTANTLHATSTYSLTGTATGTGTVANAPSDETLMDMARRVYVDAVAGAKNLGARSAAIVAQLEANLQSLRPYADMLDSDSAVVSSDAFVQLRAVYAECSDHIQRCKFISFMRNARTKKNVKKLIWQLESRCSILLALMTQQKAASLGRKASFTSVDDATSFSKEMTLCDLARRVVADIGECKAQLGAEPADAESFLLWMGDLRSRLVSFEAQIPSLVYDPKGKRHVNDAFAMYAQLAQRLSKAKQGKETISRDDIRVYMRTLDMRSSYIGYHVGLHLIAQKEKTIENLEQELRTREDEVEDEEVVITPLSRDFAMPLMMPASPKDPAQEYLKAANQFVEEDDLLQAAWQYYQAMKHSSGLAGYRLAVILAAAEDDPSALLCTRCATFDFVRLTVRNKKCSCGQNAKPAEMVTFKEVFSYLQMMDSSIEDDSFTVQLCLEQAAAHGSAAACHVLSTRHEPEAAFPFALRAFEMSAQQSQAKQKKVGIRDFSADVPSTKDNKDAPLELSDLAANCANVLAVLMVRLQRTTVQVHHSVIELLTSAASAGNMDAVYNLGFLYETGVAAQRNATVAREHYTLASRGGHIEARASLGYLNLVSGQYVEARRELIAAAESGSPAAKYYLGLMYLHGMGLQPDHPLALCYLSECVTSAMEISVDAYAPFVLLDVDDIVCKAHSRLGDMTYSGIGCVRNMALAAEHYRTAAAMGAADAANNLGLMLSSGSGVTQDVQEAMTWYAAAALRGCKFAPYNHAVLLSSMNGDHAVVVQLLRTAAQRGNDDAVVMLEGLGVKDRHLR